MPDIAAADRRQLAKTAQPKLSKWPRTERRTERINSVLRRRQPDLTIVLEDVHDRHNASAVLRACDAVGVQGIHLVYTVDKPPEEAFARTTSSGAVKWIEIFRHDSVEACYAALRAAGLTIIATALTEGNQDFYDFDLTRPTALVFGNEQRGVSALAADLADATTLIPMHGMVESLNISVACAVTLFEAMRQRRANGLYDTPRLPANEIEALRDDWLKR
ncbi:MAG: TrmH family RNA methyltransferase [Thermomicrobiales bacterium]